MIKLVAGLQLPGGQNSRGGGVMGVWALAPGAGEEQKCAQCVRHRKEHLRQPSAGSCVLGGD